MAPPERSGALLSAAPAATAVQAAESDDDGVLLDGQHGRVHHLRPDAPIVDRAARPPLGHGLRIDAAAFGQRPRARLTVLDRATDRLRRGGAAVRNLARGASLHAGVKSAPSSPGIKHRRAGRGRSPRMRGSPRGARHLRLDPGSIPADAGEPSASTPACSFPRVDPRGCGGAEVDRIARRGRQGRSPRMRGSLIVGGRPALGRGSIPADAGEPGSRARAGARRRVDPRGCGGAWRTSCCRLNGGGRSPRMRGSPGAPIDRRHHRGSIPADAGEPHGGWRRRGAGRVDPRGCGGARAAYPAGTAVEGRSPRMRGSPCQSIY